VIIGKSVVPRGRGGRSKWKLKNICFGVGKGNGNSVEDRDRGGMGVCARVSVIYPNVGDGIF